MKDKLKIFALILAISIIPTLLIWLPFIIRLENLWNIPLPQNGMATIVSNYDGPLYIVVAKTFYNPEMIKAAFNIPLPTEYYAAHFPLYPLLIRAFSYVMGYPYAMLFVTLTTSYLAIYFFYKFMSRYFRGSNLIWLTIVFSIFPARWLIARSVGSPEPLFIAAVIASVYFFQKKNYWLAALWGVAAQLTKSPGILLFIAYVLAIFIPEFKKLATKSVSESLKSLKLSGFLPLLLIPLSLLGLFYFYQVRMGDFFAYFNSGDNIHLLFPPFQIFNYSAPWVGTFWLEEIIFIYMIGLIGLMQLIKQKRIVPLWFVGVFLLSIFFVSHRDVMRYLLPIIPFLHLAYSKYEVKMEFKIVMVILILPIYLYSLAYISQNTMPISDWSPFL